MPGLLEPELVFQRLQAVKDETRRALLAVAAELARMETPDGVPRYPDGTARPGSEKTAARLSERRARYESEGRLAWSDLLLEAVGTALTEPPESEALQVRLTQVAALAMAWMQDLSRRRSHHSRSDAPPPPGTVLHVRLPPRRLVYRAVVLRNGQVRIPALNQIYRLDQLQIQRVEQDEAPPSTSSHPLRSVLDARLEELKKESGD